MTHSICNTPPCHVMLTINIMWLHYDKHYSWDRILYGKSLKEKVLKTDNPMTFWKPKEQLVSKVWVQFRKYSFGNHHHFPKFPKNYPSKNFPLYSTLFQKTLKWICQLKTIKEGHATKKKYMNWGING